MTTQDSTINTQITDSVVETHSATVERGPAESFAILDLVMTETVGMGMHNAVNAQHSMQMMASAAITATCARMINGQDVVDHGKPASSTSSSAPPVGPLAPTDPATIIAAAQSEAQKAAGTITKAASMAKQTVSEAKDALSKIGASSGDSTSDQKTEPSGGGGN